MIAQILPWQRLPGGAISRRREDGARVQFRTCRGLAVEQRRRPALRVDRLLFPRLLIPNARVAVRSKKVVRCKQIGGISAGLSYWRRGIRKRSIFRDRPGRVTAETVVDAQGDHIHVLADPAVEHTDKTRSVDVNELFACPITGGRIQYRRTNSVRSHTPIQHPRCHPSGSRLPRPIQCQ